MKGRYLILAVLLLMVVVMPTAGKAREIEPIVSTDWLLRNLDRPGLIIVDIRRVEDYRAGHIPGAVSAFYGAWAYLKDGMFGSLPDQDDLDDTIGFMGIHFDSWVVVTGFMDTPRLSYQSARVACTLQYAGVENVAILDGGVNKWIAEKKPLSTKGERPPSYAFRGKYSKEKFADKAYIKDNMGKLILIDVREREFYTGEKKMDCVPRSGRIPGAVNLPTSCAFREDKTFKSREELLTLAEAAAGKDRAAPIVTYCDMGQCCPTWSFILTQVLGYTNVRLYTGSMQEWMRDPEAPAEKNDEAGKRGR